MAEIKVSCPSCDGTSLLAEYQVRVVCFTQGGGDFYEFTCAGCREIVRYTVNDRMVYLLREGGVPCHVIERPAEACEPHTGPPITSDEVLDFALQLRHVDCPTEIIVR